uniref:toxin glutamine deamidase domain-containing protein n=1 Tax=Corynebacterium uterequi TaxID=1072256 RepID=UPI0006410EEC|nr:toxin glutamine deamidase domain-containing protein [Corynebacterium uterequi]
MPVLVVDGESWAGQEQYERLEARWREVTWSNGMPGPNQWRRWRAHVEGGNLNARDYSPFTKPKPAWQPPRGKYAGGDQVRRWQSLDATPRLTNNEEEEAYTRVNPRLEEVPDNLPEGMGKEPWKVNCVRCVSASELRRRGYDVTAGAGTFKSPADIGNAQHSLNIGWRNTETGKPPELVTWRGMTKKADQSLVKYFNKTMPDGARGFATNSWKTENELRREKWLPPVPDGDKRSGHILVWEKIGRRIVFHDPQTGEVRQTPTAYMAHKEYLNGSLSMCRIDDCQPLDGVLDVLGGDLDQWY